MASYKKLSPKRAAFAEAIAKKGLSQTDSFRATYDSDNRRTQKNSACTVAKDPEVQRAIAISRAQQARNADEMREYLLANIASKVESDNEAISLKASEMLGRIPTVDLWQEKSGARSAEISAEEIRGKLTGMLSALLVPGGTGVIDVQASATTVESDS